VIPYGPRALQKHTEDKRRQLSQVAAAAPSQASEMASYLNKRARVSSEAVTGDGDLVSDVAAGRQKLASVKDDELPENLRALKPEQRIDELDKQMKQRNALNRNSRWCKARPVAERRQARRRRHRSIASSRIR
jgi:hypothetical protein